MIIFLYGPDDYRRLQKKNGIIAEFGKKHSALSLRFFDGEADGGGARSASGADRAAALSVPDALTEFARSGSLFETAKLAVLENAFALEPEKLAAALAPLADAKGTTVLISEREKPAKALAFLLKEPVRSQQFEHLAGAEWLAFIRAEAKELGLALAPDAAQFLGAVYRGHSWALVTELQKLSALAPDGEIRAIVDKKALDALDLEAAPDYWALVDGLKSIDGRIRLRALEKLFSINDPPPKIFNILAAQAGEKTARMAEYDLAVKSGKLDYEEALLDLVLG